MTAVETVLEIVNVLMSFKPLKVFLPGALILLLLGLGWALPFLLAGRGMSGFGLLLMLTGLLLAMLGLISEQMASLRRVDLSDVIARPIRPE
jgi:O-antigen ligase